MDWLDLLAVQGTLKSLLQHHSSKASIFQCSAFFTVQLSHPNMTTRKTIALTRQTFVGKVISLLFNMLSRLVITFLPRSKHLLISWLQSPSTVILEPQKIKSDKCDSKESHQEKWLTGILQMFQKNKGGRKSQAPSQTFSGECLIQLLKVFRCQEISFQQWIVMSRDEETQIYLFSILLQTTAMEFQVNLVYEQRAFI